MKQVFVADDGKEFENAEECNQYEQMTDIRSKIDAWSKAKYAGKKGQATKMMNGAVAWEAARNDVLGQVAPL